MQKKHYTKKRKIYGMMIDGKILYLNYIQQENLDTENDIIYFNVINSTAC